MSDKLPDGQNRSHYVLPDEELAKGFIRPVRDSYKHLTCGVVTKMGSKIAQTYARKPTQYTSTWCVGCKKYLPVGAKGKGGEFVWDGTDEYVGT